MHSLNVRVFLLTLGLFIIFPARPAENLSFRGTLIEPPPCKINDGGMIDVDFGERVGVNKVDGNNYMQRLNYRITCQSGGSGLGLMLIFSGDKTSYDDSAIETSKENLGIRIFLDFEKITLGKPVPVNPGQPPIIMVVPVKKPGSTLKQGPFNATATLLANYE